MRSKTSAPIIAVFFPDFFGISGTPAIGGTCGGVAAVSAIEGATGISPPAVFTAPARFSKEFDAGGAGGTGCAGGTGGITLGILESGGKIVSSGMENYKLITSLSNVNEKGFNVND